MQRIFVIIFLLLLVSSAVFIYTAKRAEPQALKLFAPKDEGQDSFRVAKPEFAFTVILTGKNDIYFYSGNFDTNASVGKTDYKEIRNILLNKKKDLGPDLTVIIKPDGKSTYKNTVAMLDEMSNNDIKRYALVDLTNEEAERLGLAMQAGR